MTTRSYSQARAELAALMDKAVDDRETIIIERRGRPAVALIAADELRGMEETLHLLRSPANASRLLAALERARAGAGEPVSDEELQRLRAGLALGPQE